MTNMGQLDEAAQPVRRDAQSEVLPSLIRAACVNMNKDVQTCADFDDVEPCKFCRAADELAALQTNQCVLHTKLKAITHIANDNGKRAHDLTAKCEALQHLVDNDDMFDNLVAEAVELRAKCEQKSDMLKIRTVERDEAEGGLVQLTKLVAELTDNLDAHRAKRDRLREALSCIGSEEFATADRCAEFARAALDKEGGERERDANGVS